MRQIAHARTDVAGALGELDRRRRRFFDVRGQLRRNPIPLLAIAVVLLGVAVGGIELARTRHRRRNQLRPRLSRLQEAVRRMVENPKRVATDQGVGRKIVGAAGAAAASVLARKLAQRFITKPASGGKPASG